MRSILVPGRSPGGFSEGRVPSRRRDLLSEDTNGQIRPSALEYLITRQPTKPGRLQTNEDRPWLPRGETEGKRENQVCKNGREVRIRLCMGRRTLLLQRCDDHDVGNSGSHQADQGWNLDHKSLHASS